MRVNSHYWAVELPEICLPGVICDMDSERQTSDSPDGCYGNIVVLTHPFEYIKKSDFRYSNLTKNRVNQQRLIRLCEFIQCHPGEFVAVDFSSQHQGWLASELNQPAVKIPSVFAVGRELHNALNDRVWNY